MKELCSVAELSKILDVSARSVRNRAINEGWKFFHGKRRVYLFKGLPLDVQRKIISHQIGCHIDFIPFKNPDALKSEAGLRKFNESLEYNRKIAQARWCILDKLSEFIKLKNLKQTQGEKRFASFYNTGLIEQVEPWILEKVPSVSAPSLRRWRRKKSKHGLSGLLGGFGNRKGDRKAVTSAHSQFIISHITKKPHIRGSHLFKLLCKDFDDHPSRRAVYRFLKSWRVENLQLSTLIKDPRRWKNSYMPAFGSASAGVLHFLHTVEGDSTPADLSTSDGKRPSIIGLIDIYSRRAVIVVAQTSKSIAIAAALRKAMIAWGIPDRLKIDNGRDYQSLHIQAVTTTFEIETPPLPKYSPEKKPFIERFFGTFSRGLEELLPGYCGHSVNERQALREKETWASKIMTPGAIVEVPLSMEEFQALADRWVHQIYERSPHKGLGDRTPLEVARGSLLQPPKIRDERILDLLLAPVGYRTVQKKGIAIDGSFFISPGLIEHIGRRVEIRRDLSNAGLLYVFDGMGKYLCQATNEPLEGLALEEYLTAKKRHAKNLKGVKRALDKMGPNHTAIQTLLDDVGNDDDESNIVPFQLNFENPNVREARRAVSDFSESPIAPPVEMPRMAVNYASTDHLIDNSWYSAEDHDREFKALLKRQTEKLKLTS